MSVCFLCGVLRARKRAASRRREISTFPVPRRLIGEGLVPRLISHTFIGGNWDSSYYNTTDPCGPRPGGLDNSILEQLAEIDPIWAERGKAIQSYALLEQSLCDLFGFLSDTKDEIAATIFYKITSTGSRNAILDKLLRRKFGNKYNLFWNIYLKSLRPIDTRRNEIVHWLSAAITGLDRDSIIHCGVVLVPAKYSHIFIRSRTYRNYSS